VKVLVTGREGQVARCLAAQAEDQRDLEMIFAARPELDLARPETIAPLVRAVRPDVVVSAAAYTAVDQAEDEPELAFAVNGAGAGEVAKAAASVGAPVIHLSTDYVFDGTLHRPYREDDPTGPQGVYGASKLAGERAIAEANSNHLIMRTAWVYSPFGKNFVKTMLRLAETRDEVSVVADQWGNPTSAGDIAEAVLVAARRLVNGDVGAWGIYHFAGEGEATWADFAEEIFRASTERGGPSARVIRIATSDYPTRALRPANSQLESAKFVQTFDLAPRRWLENCHRVVLAVVDQRDR
jgi:dTDP-4-dehydrorhamnose reductase